MAKCGTCNNRNFGTPSLTQGAENQKAYQPRKHVEITYHGRRKGVQVWSWPLDFESGPTRISKFFIFLLKF